MSDKQKVDAYLEKHEQWKTQFTELRKVLQRTELEETVKWGAPTYTVDGRIVASFVGFKNHCALWFHQGVYLEDKAKKLVNAQEGTTRGLRQWRFEAGDKVDPALVKSYVTEAIRNQRAGRQIKPRKKQLIIPPELSAAMDRNSGLRKNFESLSPGKQREFAEHISSAKRAATRESRLEQIIPMINAGKGLYDKYKKC